MEVPNTTILNKKIISLKGEISRYGMNQNGLLYAVIYEHITDKLIDSRLIGISMEAGILWEHKGQLSFPIELRIDPNSGKAYISQNNTISYVNQLGVTEKEITLEVEEHQEIGSFVILPNGFIISLQSKGKPNTAVIRTDFNGNIIWKER